MKEVNMFKGIIPLTLLLLFLSAANGQTPPPALEPEIEGITRVLKSP
jgi:hypothetical protein